MRDRIQRAAGKGGHGPFAQRGVTAETVRTLSRQWRTEAVA